MSRHVGRSRGSIGEMARARRRTEWGMRGINISVAVEFMVKLRFKIDRIVSFNTDYPYNTRYMFGRFSPPTLSLFL